jgi:hypothetical protein
MGNPIDEAAQARINETIQDALKVFATEFSKSYTQAVIDNAKAEIEPETDILDDLKLQEAPVPSHILKTGMLFKVRFGDQFVSFNAPSQKSSLLRSCRKEMSLRTGRTDALSPTTRLITSRSPTTTAPARPAS